MLAATTWARFTGVVEAMFVFLCLVVVDCTTKEHTFPIWKGRYRWMATARRLGFTWT